MATAVTLLTLPFRAAWSLLRLLFLPVAVVAAAGLLLGPGSVWFGGLVLLCGLWALVLVRLWWLQLRGVLRSLARGTVQVAGPGRARPRRRRRGAR
jgi:hypothetical protein